MAWYDVKCDSCGKEFRVQLLGKVKDREWKVEHCTWTCEECRDKEQKEKAQAAATANAEAGLPPLKGTEKQIAWAEQIRAEVQPVIDGIKEKVQNVILKFREDGNEEEVKKYEEALVAAEYIAEHSWASYWIENRDRFGERFIMQEMERVLPGIRKKEARTERENTQVAIDVKAEATVRPEEPITETVAEIENHENLVSVFLPEKRDDFRAAMREYGYRWSGRRWEKDINSRTGTAGERMAEIGNQLLLRGFIIRIYDSEIRENAINGIYPEEQKRWVMARGNSFLLSWPLHEQNLYAKAKKYIRRSTWDREGNVLKVPSEFFEDVLDFAKVYKFSRSEEAEVLAKEAEEVKGKALVCAPVEKEPEPEPEKIPEPEEYDIDESLRDDN